ncbi:hypothetical protein ABZV31_07175 [Streptomyces sp. NPDC005202]
MDNRRLTGGSRPGRLVAKGLRQKQQLVHGIARAAVFVRAHNRG